MTTIATDGVTIAADGMVCEGDCVIQTSYRKLRRFKDGRIIGFSGNAFNDDAFASWLERGGKDELPKGLVGEEFCCIELTVGGEIATYDEYGRRFVELPPYAIGSGRKWAKAAMALGKSPKEAVEFASRFDVYTGGDITVLHPNVRNVEAA